MVAQSGLQHYKVFSRGRTLSRLDLGSLYPDCPLDAGHLVIVGLGPEDEPAYPVLVEDAPGAAGYGAAAVDSRDGGCAGDLLDLLVGNVPDLGRQDAGFPEKRTNKRNSRNSKLKVSH